MAEIAVLGAGVFGTALAIHCEANGHNVSVWSRSKAEIFEENSKIYHKKIPQIQISDKITFTNDLKIVKNSEIVIFAIPSFAIRENCRQISSLISRETIIVCVAKGLEKGTFKDLATVISEELPENPCVILSGPSFAAEIARSIPTTVVAASKNLEAADKVQDLLMDKNFRIYVSDDLVGVELGGALKNIIAVCSGICDGLLENSANAKAALMTRGITEIARLGVAMGGKQETFAGLSGIGDLMLTCSGSQSRNYKFGKLLSEGMSAEEALAAVGMVVEGYYCTEVAYELAAKLGIEMPIVNQAYEVLYKNKNPKQAIMDLMSRPKRNENEEIWLKKI